MERFNQNLKKFLDDNIEENFQTLRTAYGDYDPIAKKKDDAEDILVESLSAKQNELFDCFCECLMQVD